MNSRIFPTDTIPFLAGRRGARPAMAMPGDADQVDLRGLLRGFWTRRWQLFGAMLALGLLTWFAVGQITPVYSAQSKVILDPRKPQIITNDKVVADLDPSEQIVNGEIAVLRSNLLLEDVIRTIGVENLTTLDPANAPASLPSRLVSGIGALLGRGGTDDAAPVDPDAPPPLLSPEEQQMERLVWAIRQNLQVYSEGQSYVITIRTDAHDPLLAMVLANAIAERYIGLQLGSRREAVGQATDWLEERLQELKIEVEEAEAAVSQYRAESLVKDGGTLENATQQLANLNTQLITARAERVEAEARYTQLQSVVADQGKDVAARIVTTPVLEALRSQALDLRQKDAVWAQSYDANHPRRVEIRKELEQIDADIARELDKVIEVRSSDLEIARIRERSLQESIALTEEKVMSISRNGLGLLQLDREAAAARQTYEALLSRVTETRTQKQLQQPDAKLIERATIPGAPSAPRPKLMAALAAAAGGLAMAGWILFNELAATTFRSARELETETGLPVLASIPLQNWPGMMAGIKALRKSPYGAYGERIRQLRTALLMRDGREAAQSVLMLSSAPGEGKTTTAIALAEMSALAGKSVILIDGDLRRATLQRAFGWKMKHDFAEFITGGCTLDQAIHVPPDCGFDVLASTGPRTDAAEELSGAWLKPVIDELKRVYDVVLIDAPALLAVSDALILAQAVDSRIYVVACDSTPRAAVMDGLSRLAEQRLGVTGMVLNKVDARRSPDPNAKGYTYDL